MRLFQGPSKPNDESSETLVPDAAPPAPEATPTPAPANVQTTPAVAPLVPSPAAPFSPPPTTEPSTSSPISEIQPTATIREIVGAVTQGLAKAASEHALYVRALYGGSDPTIPHVVISRATLNLKLGVAGQGNAADGADETHFLIGADALAHLPAELVSTLSLDLRMERED